MTRARVAVVVGKVRGRTMAARVTAMGSRMRVVIRVGVVVKAAVRVVVRAGTATAVAVVSPVVIVRTKATGLVVVVVGAITRSTFLKSGTRRPHPQSMDPYLGQR